VQIVDLGQGTLRLAAPIKQHHGWPGDGVRHDLVCVTGQELPAACDAQHRSAIAEPPAAVTVGAEEDAGGFVAGAQAVEPGVAHCNAHGRGFEVSAGGHADMVCGVYEAAVNTEKPFLAGKAVACAEQPGKVGFNVVGVALGAFDHKCLHGTLGERAQGFCRHCHMVFDEAGDNLGAFVVDTLGSVSVDEQGERIVARDLGNLGLRLLPICPQPGLVDVLAEPDSISGHVLRIRRHQASGGTAVEVGDYNEQLRTGDFLRHSAAAGVKATS
jgi:hypothetical protein